MIFTDFRARSRDYLYTWNPGTSDSSTSLPSRMRLRRIILHKHLLPFLESANTCKLFLCLIFAFTRLWFDKRTIWGSHYMRCESNQLHMPSQLPTTAIRTAEWVTSQENASLGSLPNHWVREPSNWTVLSEEGIQVVVHSWATAIFNYADLLRDALRCTTRHRNQQLRFLALSRESSLGASYIKQARDHPQHLAICHQHTHRNKQQPICSLVAVGSGNNIS